MFGRMKRSAGVGLLVATTLALSAWVGSSRASAAHLLKEARPARISSSSRLLLGGRVRCTASINGVVQAGQDASIKLVLRNVSRHTVRYQSWVTNAQAVVKAADGTTYDSSAYLGQLFSIPPPTPGKLSPGAKPLRWQVNIPVRWYGPLQITPECLGKALPVLHVRVTAPGTPSSQSAAVDEVVAASGHLLDQCRPQTPGFPVSGQIDPPSGTALPMNAQCSVSLSSEGRFWVAQVLVLVPPSLTGVQIFQPYELFWGGHYPTGLTADPPYEAIAWEFVVTRDKAVPVAASTVTATNSSKQSAPSFEWHPTGFRQDGSGPCGFTGFSFGGVGPWLEFIGGCG